MFWLSRLEVETWSCSRTSCVYIQPLPLGSVEQSFDLREIFIVKYVTRFDTWFLSKSELGTSLHLTVI